MSIRTKDGLRTAYENLSLWKYLRSMTPPDKLELVDEKILRYKRRIREYHKHSDNEPEHRFLSHDYDYGVEIVILPGDLTREQVDKYYDLNMHRECMPSMYDCTGQIFTVWHRVVRTGAGWKIYHGLAMDV